MGKGNDQIQLERRPEQTLGSLDSGGMWTFGNLWVTWIYKEHQATTHPAAKWGQAVGQGTCAQMESSVHLTLA